MKIETFSHYQNITHNIQDLPINTMIDSEIDYYIAGGYAMALIFAPRNQDLYIDTNYYDDIDIYFSSEQDLNNSIESIKQKEITIIEENEKWFVFKMTNPETNNSYTFQIVKTLFSTSPSFFSAYDILNCCIAFSAKTNDFYYKPLAIEATVCKLIELNDTFTFDEEKYIKFSYRLNKFLARYKMKISDTLHSTLLYNLIRNKDYKTTKEWNFKISWSTGEIENIPPELNIWSLYRYAFSTNPKHIKYLSNYYKQEIQ